MALTCYLPPFQNTATCQPLRYIAITCEIVALDFEYIKEGKRYGRILNTSVLQCLPVKDSTVGNLHKMPFHPST